MTTKSVVHCKMEPFDVYIGRPSVWGNPFSHKVGTLAKYRVATITEAISRYREWLLAQPELVERAKRELRGKVLGCWCKTKKNPNAPCHGNVLVEVANDNRCEVCKNEPSPDATARREQARRN